MGGRTPEFPSEKIVSLVPELTGKLEAGLCTIEPRFTDLGQHLQNIYTESSGLAEEIMVFANSMTEQNEGTFRHDIEKMVADSLNVLSGCRDTLTGSLERINNCAEHLSELHAICERIQKSAVFLNVVGLNISVEGCRTSEVMEMFENFGNEIKQLATNIGQISETISEKAEKARKDQHLVSKEITTSMTTFNELSQSAKKAVQSAIEEITTIGDMAASTLEIAGGHSRKISKTVGGIVISIQFHDIVRQQIEHIVSALQDVLSLLNDQPEIATDPDPAGTDGDENIKRGRIYSVLALQAAHLRHIVTELENVFDNMKNDYRTIGEEVSLLIENVEAAHSEQTGASGFDQKLENFKAELEKLQQVLSRGNILDGKIRKTMNDSSRTVSEFSDHTSRVTSINIDLQYKAINAIIMTNKLGEKGVTLEVLARSVRDLSADLDELTNSVLEKIDAITGLENDSGSTDNDQPEPQGDIAASALEIGKGIERLSNASERYQDSMAASEEKAGHLLESIEKTNQYLDFFPEWITETAQVLEQMEAMLKLLSPWESLGKELSSEMKDEIAKRYTMEKERMIHEQLTMENTAGNNGDKSDAAVELSESEETEDLDDNIELF